MNSIRQIMESYCRKTSGSFIEELDSTITWNFEHTDLMFGRVQAKELKAFIATGFENMPINVIDLDFKVQVRSKEFKTDTFLKRIIGHEIIKLPKKTKIDFIFFVGYGSLVEPDVKVLNRLSDKLKNVCKQLKNLKNNNRQLEFDQLKARLEGLNSAVSHEAVIYTTTISKKGTLS